MNDSANLHSLLERPLGDLVTERTRTAAVFERFGLDYCCHGQQTLADAARDRGVDVEVVLAALAAVPNDPDDRADAILSADLDELTRHIVDVHHGYVRTTVPVLQAWFERLVDRHGDRHPELTTIRSTFDRLAEEIRTHMGKEENILFPYIDAMAAAQRAGTGAPGGPFGTVVNPVRVMEDDHTLVGELMDQVRILSGDFTPPPDGCRTYTICFDELATFAADLHRHIHLENHVLFPRAIELERRLWG